MQADYQESKVSQTALLGAQASGMELPRLKGHLSFGLP